VYIAYLDESGDTGKLPSTTSPVQPIFVPAAIVCKQSLSKDLTLDFLHLKQRFFPGLVGESELFLDRMLAEIKGSEIRKHARGASRRQRRHALGFLDGLVHLLESFEIEIIGRVWVKKIDRENNGRALYTYSVQDICSTFQHLLESRGSQGMVIADSRNYPQNTNLSHSIFTGRFSSEGDRYTHLLEMPTFGHSNNHAGLQIADLLCSALLFPIATYTYCYPVVRNVHVSRAYGVLKDRYGVRLRRRLYTYRDANGKVCGGITVSDGIGGKASSALFR